MLLVGIVILNYNGNQDTLECLNSITTHLSSDHFKFKIYLIDNNSRNPIAEDILEQFPLDICYVKNEKNLGFAEGNNVGITRSIKDGCDYVMLLNNDTILVDDSIQRTLKYIRSNPSIGIAGLINYYFDEQDKIWQAGFIADLVKAKNIAIIRNDSRLDSEFYFADFVPGSSMIIKREVVEKIGMLNKRYFAYYEDIDYCIRTKKAGFKVGFYANSKILHKVSKSSTSALRIYLRTRNKLLFYKTHAYENFKQIYCHLFFRSMGNIIESLFKKGNKLRVIKGYYYAFVDFHKNKFEEGSINKFI